jgi:hypothetical protein
MSIEVNPKPETKFGSKFEVTLTGVAGRTINATGSPSGTSVRVEIHEPARGYGAAEKPERFAEIEMPARDFVEWTARVLQAIDGSIK